MQLKILQNLIWGFKRIWDYGREQKILFTNLIRLNQTDVVGSRVKHVTIRFFKERRISCTIKFITNLTFILTYHEARNLTYNLNIFIKFETVGNIFKGVVEKP